MSFRRLCYIPPSLHADVLSLDSFTSSLLNDVLTSTMQRQLDQFVLVHDDSTL